LNIPESNGGSGGIVVVVEVVLVVVDVVVEVVVVEVVLVVVDVVVEVVVVEVVLVVVDVVVVVVVEDVVVVVSSSSRSFSVGVVPIALIIQFILSGSMGKNKLTLIQLHFAPPQKRWDRLFGPLVSTPIIMCPLPGTEFVETTT
jgi:hypothetical protein